MKIDDKMFYKKKYTNPARGILELCKQKFFSPTNAYNETYTACTPCFEVSFDELLVVSNQTTEQEHKTCTNFKRPPLTGGA